MDYFAHDTKYDCEFGYNPYKRFYSVEEITEKLKEYKIYSLWHYTNIENLKGIIENGFLSKKQLEDHSIPYKIGGNELSINLDIKKGNYDCSYFAFTPYQPMAFLRSIGKYGNDSKINRRKEHLIYMEFDINLLKDLKDRVKFTEMNSTANDVNEGLIEENFLFFHNANMWNYNPQLSPFKKLIQAEVLVKSGVEPELLKKHIKAIHFISPAALEYGKTIVGNREFFLKRMRVTPSLYYNVGKFPSISSMINHFPYLEKVLLCDKEDENNCYPKSHNIIYEVEGQGSLKIIAIGYYPFNKPEVDENLVEKVVDVYINIKELKYNERNTKDKEYKMNVQDFKKIVIETPKQRKILIYFKAIYQLNLASLEHNNIYEISISIKDDYTGDKVTWYKKRLIKRR